MCALFECFVEADLLAPKQNRSTDLWRTGSQDAIRESVSLCLRHGWQTCCFVDCSDSMIGAGLWRHRADEVEILGACRAVAVAVSCLDVRLRQNGIEDGTSCEVMYRYDDVKQDVRVVQLVFSETLRRCAR